MKTLSLFYSHTSVQVSIVTALLCFSLPTRLPAPQGPETLDYGPLGVDYGGGSFLDFVPVPSEPGLVELDDWSIATPAGIIDPIDSILVGESEGDWLVPYDIPNDDLIFAGIGALAGDTIDVDPGGDLPGQGLITDFDNDGTHTSAGTFSLPDKSSTLPLLFFAGIVLAVTVPRRRAYAKSRGD